MEELVIEKVSVSDLLKDPANLRKHDSKNLMAIKGSLQRFGQRKPIVIDKRNIIVAGNGTYEAALALGWDFINIVRTELEGPELTAFAIADNRSSELAEWDEDSLKKTLKDLHDLNFDLSQIGFQNEDWMKPEKRGLGKDQDNIPEIDHNIYNVKRGDIWRLGDSRLMCGDSTLSYDVNLLVDGAKMDLWWTDPPYNVSYVGKTKEKLVILNDKFNEGEYLQFLIKAFRNAGAVMKKGAAFYICHADTFGLENRQALISCETKFHLSGCLIWKKNALVFGRADYHWKHEPILYGWLEGSSHTWYSDRTQTTVLEFDKPAKSESHPTMKPVSLIEYMILNSTNNNNYIYDSFGGSGSTLIASVKNNRKCYLMELDEHYCSIIIKRWEDFTNEKAERLNI
jgi:site-specific DNA-methyltransferase (adenine-specific)